MPKTKWLCKTTLSRNGREYFTKDEIYPSYSNDGNITGGTLALIDNDGDYHSVTEGVWLEAFKQV